MKCPSCGHSWQAERKGKTQPAEKSTADMSTAELYAHYKRTSHIEDARFFSQMLARAGLGPLANQAIVLLVEAEHGLPRAEVLRRLTRLQESWRTKDQPVIDEGKFWRKCRQLGAKERGKEYRAQRDRVISHIKEAGITRSSYYSATPPWSMSETVDGMIDEVKREVRKLVQAARVLCPAIVAEAAA